MKPSQFVLEPIVERYGVRSRSDQWGKAFFNVVDTRDVHCAECQEERALCRCETIEEANRIKRALNKQEES